jgi:hypothetical protein
MSGDDAPGRAQNDPATYQVRVAGGVSGQVVVGDSNVVIDARTGSSVTVRSGPLPSPRRRRRPVGRPLPRQGPELLGRSGELRQLAEWLDEGVPVQVYGPFGVGKSALLRRLALDRAAGGDHVVFLSAAGLPVDDVIQELFQACYDVEDYRPEPARLRRLMGSIKALLVVDDFAGSAEEVTALLDAAPACDVVMASPEESIGGSGRSLRLGGLRKKPGMALLARALGRSLREEEAGPAEELWHLVDGHPLDLIQAAAAVRAVASGTGVSLAMGAPALAPVIAAHLSEGARQILSVLCGAGEVPVPADVLAALAETAGLAELEDLGLVVSGAAGHTAAGPLATLVVDHAECPPDALAESLLTWVRQAATLGDIVRAAPVIESILRRAVAGGHHSVARDLARLTAPAFGLTLRWGNWRRVLALGRQAAHELGAADDEAYFTGEEHVLVRALGKGAAAGAAVGGAFELGHIAGRSAATHGRRTLAKTAAAHPGIVAGVSAAAVAAAVIGGIAATRSGNASNPLPDAQPPPITTSAPFSSAVSTPPTSPASRPPSSPPRSSPRTLTVPSGLVGNDVGNARSILSSAGLAAHVVREDSTTAVGGTVLSAQPAEGTPIAPGSTVTLRVARAMVTVPEVLPDPEADAAFDIQEAGLVPVVVTTHRQQPGVEDGQAVSISPKAGTMVPAGSKVTVVVYQQASPIPSIT